MVSAAPTAGGQSSARRPGEGADGPDADNPRTALAPRTAGERADSLIVACFSLPFRSPRPAPTLPSERAGDSVPLQRLEVGMPPFFSVSLLRLSAAELDAPALSRVQRRSRRHAGLSSTTQPGGSVSAPAGHAPAYQDGQPVGAGHSVRSCPSCSPWQVDGLVPAGLSDRRCRQPRGNRQLPDLATSDYALPELDASPPRVRCAAPRQQERLPRRPVQVDGHARHE